MVYDVDESFIDGLDELLGEVFIVMVLKATRTSEKIASASSLSRMFFML